MDKEIELLKALDQKKLAIKYDEARFTDFLNATHSAELMAMKAEHGLMKVSFGGYEEAERKIICYAPSFDEVFESDFPITCFRLLCPYQQKEISHRDVLGSILGLGIKRDKVGDILVGKEEIIVFVSSEIAPFVLEQWRAVGRNSVTVKEISMSEACAYQKDKQSILINVASMRLDAVVAACLKLARTKAVALIDSDRVSINWRVCNAGSHTVSDGDVLSIKGYGRFNMIGVKGNTKKGRFVVEIEVFGRA